MLEDHSFNCHKVCISSFSQKIIIYIFFNSNIKDYFNHLSDIYVKNTCTRSMTYCGNFDFYDLSGYASIYNIILFILY